MSNYLSRLQVLALGTLVATLAPAALDAQEDELFSFVPPGGRTLLGQLIDKGKVRETDVLPVTRSREEWRRFVDEIDDAALDEVARDTLADYLASTMPAAEKGGQLLDTAGTALPRDGRDLTMEYCQSCHIITVVVTQDRSREAWLGTMNKPSHVEIDTTQAEREAIADYLIRNGGISIDDVPEELRAGGATY